MRLRRRTEDTDVVRITALPPTVSQDIATRQRRYLISMGIRTLCFIGAVISYRVPWLCATLIVASFLLPFIAVVIANTASPRIDEHLEGPGFNAPDRPELEQ